MILQLKAKHFEGQNDDTFMSNDCPIGVALKPFGNAIICFDSLWMTEGARTVHSFESYGMTKFREDQVKAQAANYDDTVIREIDIPTLNLI